MRVFLDYIFDWLPFGLAVPVLIGAGFAMLADEFKSFTAARVCFYVSTAWIYGKVFMWAYLTSDRFFVRGVVVFLVFGFVGVALIETLRLVTYREAKNTPRENPPPPAASVAASPPMAAAPDGLTLTPDAGDIRLTFKSSPAYTASVQKRITADLTRFRNYLIRLGIPVPKDLPPIGTSETKSPGQVVGSGFYTRPGLPTYRGGLIIDHTMVNNRFLITSVYCDYVMSQLLTGVASPLNAQLTDMRSMVSVTSIFRGSSTYLNFSFWNKPQKKRPVALLAPLPGALWDVRKKFGSDFTDKMLGFTFRAMRDEPMGNSSESVDDYFLRKLRVGESVVDNDGSSWPEIQEILKKNKFPTVWK